MPKKQAPKNVTFHSQSCYTTKKLDIEDRRKQIRSMLARSKTEQEIADKLGKSRMTISRDIKAMREERQQFIYDLSKSDLAFYYQKCLDTLTEVQRETWAIHDRNNPKDKFKLQVLGKIADFVQAEFSMFKDGPAMQHIKSLHEKISRITKDES